VILFFVPVGDLVGALASTMVSQHARAVARSTLLGWHWEGMAAGCPNLGQKLAEIPDGELLRGWDDYFVDVESSASNSEAQQAAWASVDPAPWGNLDLVDRFVHLHFSPATSEKRGCAAGKHRVSSSPPLKTRSSGSKRTD